MILAASFDVKEPEQWLNRALMYGDGLFETMRLHQREIPLWAFHMQRLRDGLEVLAITPPDEQTLVNAIKENCPVQLQSSAVIKLLVFRDQIERTYQPKSSQSAWLLIAEPFSSDQETAVHLGWAQGTLSQQTATASIKHLSRLEQVLLAAELNVGSHDDLLVCDHLGHVIETTYQNLVMIQDKQLFTPPLSQCGVHGVALRWLQNQFEVTTKAVHRDALCQVDGLMVCNALRGFRWVQSLKGEHSFGTSHPIHDKIKLKWLTQFNQ